MNRRRLLLLSLLLAAAAVAPLLAPGYFIGAHDGPHSLFFLVEFDGAIRDGYLIPRWGADQALGYGYPTFVFYSPLAYYLAEGFHLMGAGITLAVKLTYALATLLATAGMFVFVENWLGPAAGFIAALVYCFAPYRFVDMYVRSALAETCALAIFPWVLWAFGRLARRPTARRMAVAALAYGSLLLTHNVTALLFTPLVALVALFAIVASRRLRDWRAWGYSLGAGTLAIGVAAFSLLPMLGERGDIVQEQWTRATYRLTDHFVYPHQLLSPLWGYGYAVPGPEDGMSLQLGLVSVVLATAGALFGLSRRRTRPLAAVLTLGMAAYTFMLLPPSAPVWQALPMLSLAQFPWRLLGVTALCAAALAGVAWRALPGERPVAVAVLLGLAALVIAAPIAHPQHTPPSSRAEQPVAAIDFELAHPDMIGVTRWVEQAPATSPKLAAYLNGTPLPLAEADLPGATVRTLHSGTHVQTVAVAMPAAGLLRFYTYYYPGWRAYIDGREAPVHPSGPQAVVTLDVPAGEHNVSLRFGDTPLRAAGKWASLAAMTTVAVVSLWPFRPLRGRRSQ